MDIPIVDVVATCETPDCGNAGIPIGISVPEGGYVACGVCGELIESVERV